MNKIVLSGRIVKDAELRFTKDGTAIANFAIAVREYSKKEDKQTLFMDLTVWGKRAEALNPYLKKGVSILVDGRLDVSKRTAENGKSYTNVRVYVSDLEFLSKKEQSEGSASGSAAAGPEAAEQPTSESEEEVPF